MDWLLATPLLSTPCTVPASLSSLATRQSPLSVSTHRLGAHAMSAASAVPGGFSLSAPRRVEDATDEPQSLAMDTPLGATAPRQRNFIYQFYFYEYKNLFFTMFTRAPILCRDLCSYHPDHSLAGCVSTIHCYNTITYKMVSEVGSLSRTTLTNFNEIFIKFINFNYIYVKTNSAKIVRIKLKSFSLFDTKMTTVSNIYVKISKKFSLSKTLFFLTINGQVIPFSNDIFIFHESDIFFSCIYELGVGQTTTLYRHVETANNLLLIPRSHFPKP